MRGKKENLTRLGLVDLYGGNLPARGLAIIMRHARKLQTLWLGWVRMVGSDEDFAEFVQELQRHAALKDLRLIGCLPIEETTRIQVLAETLSSSKTLKVVQIAERKVFPPWKSWAGKAFAALCQSSS